jgi:hypothetical protein
MKAAHLAFLVFSSVGCISLAPEPEEFDVRIVLNSISLADLQATQTAYSDLALGELDLDSPAGQALIATDSGRDVAAFLVACALPKGQRATGRVDGTRYVFDGELGLANGWKNGAPSFSEKRWVSGCMLARINFYGLGMKISIHGPHSGLFVNNADRSTYGLEEGAFYGDIFTGSAPIVGWSCRGVSQQGGDPNTGSALDARDCAEREGGTTNVCGWGFSGECNISTSSSGRACDVKVSNGSGYYERCHDAPGALTWDEVITVYVNDGPPVSN